jgi:hypothetical protein
VIPRNAVWTLFAAAALYDFILGFAFLLVPGSIFARCGVTPPNHFGYVQFPGALLIAFALMYAAIARDPQANRNLIPFGALLKVAYCGVVFGYWFTSGIPDMWKPFAVADLAFLVLFGWAWSSLTPAKRRLTDA